MILGFLKMWWKEIAIVIFIAGIYFYWHHLQSEIASGEAKIAQLNVVNGVLKDNNDKLELAIKTNNTAVQALSDGADKTKADFATLNATVSAQLSALSPKLSAILKSQKPVTCEDTVKYLLNARTEYPK